MLKPLFTLSHGYESRVVRLTLTREAGGRKGWEFRGLSDGLYSVPARYSEGPQAGEPWPTFRTRQEGARWGFANAPAFATWSPQARAYKALDTAFRAVATDRTLTVVTRTDTRGPGSHGANVPGESLTMGDGSVWFHPFDGAAPSQTRPAGTAYRITYRPAPGAARTTSTAYGADMESALAAFNLANPEAVSPCIYNPDHWEPEGAEANG